MRRPTGGLGWLGLATAIGVAGCYDVGGFGDLEFRDVPVAPSGFEPVEALSSGVQRMDLLLVVDSSRSMADKQQVLGLAVPDLVAELVNPWCVDPEYQLPRQRPALPTDPCPEGMSRQFEPVLDIHVGLISSSLGSHGGDVCPAEEANATNDDQAHLLTRSAASVETYQGLGFLAWDPAQQLEPPGESDLEDLTDALGQLVAGVGEIGCGFEATLESWYRFLIDPQPPERVLVQDGVAVLEGVDEVLLAQRQDFVRPDSLLVIVMLSDENDCSIIDGGYHYMAAMREVGGGPYHLPSGRTVCRTDPASACCVSCGQAPPAGCPDDPDPACEQPLSELDDPINLRCFDQKRRFGIDFLYPIRRYRDGLTSPMVEDREANLVINPIFPPIVPDNPEYGRARDSRMVVLVGVVGVPWHDVARLDGHEMPDLLAGLDGDGRPVGGLQSAAELSANGTWDLILGDPDEGVPPTDPLMHESVDPRSGLHPLTGDPIAPPSADYLANPINGHERSIGDRDDLQYTCIFPLAEARDCSGSTELACDCGDGLNADNPLCQDADGSYGPTQYFAKAYPGIRQLQLLRQLGTQGIVGSVCPAQLDDPGSGDFGYQPAVQSVASGLQVQLQQDPCLAEARPATAERQIGCALIEARSVGEGVCTCDRREYRDGIEASCPECVAFVEQIPGDPQYAAEGYDCFCTIEQAVGGDLYACQTQIVEPVTNPQFSHVVHGWCYVDPFAFPPLGAEGLVVGCSPGHKRRIRFLGDGHPEPGAGLFLVCP